MDWDPEKAKRNWIKAGRPLSMYFTPADWTSDLWFAPMSSLAIWDRNNPVGVPQGASTSPVMSNIALKVGLYDRLPGMIVGYADDGLVFPASSQAPPRVEFPEAGIYLKDSATGWVKRDGVWLKPLKFLGMQYDP